MCVTLQCDTLKVKKSLIHHKHYLIALNNMSVCHWILIN